MRSMDDVLTGARDLLRGQRGVLTRAQALDAGLTGKAIEVKLRSGRWQRLQTGVYTTFSGEPPRDSWLWAAVLRAGPVERPHGLPPPRRQNPVRRGGRSQYQDLSYDDYALVVELDGREAHPEWYRWADIRRDNATAATGQVTLRYGWGDVTDSPCRTALEIAATLRERGWTGALRRCGAACLVRWPRGQRA